ncbi:MAG TPA: hypothetical protein ENJ44_00200, partial [Oceanospirillales bacterium]|nr:hypothetical protein [Oceanospirillales bacterium]
HRFKHEAKTIAQLDHPSIINIYNIGQTKKGEIYFTMPYLNHGDLSNYILEDEQEFINLLIPICDGLAFAHNRGVIHRDIKPENLLFDKFGNIVIADFGIAISKEGSRMTKEHQIVGSAQYMSPEQARSLKVGAHSDIYSLGIVIYERLTGSVPFDSDDSISILVNHVSMEPPKLPAKMRHWQELIDKCLAKSPKDRFADMLELKKAIQNIPTNSIQRTSDTIQRVLNDEKGKHLKWFVPLLLIIMLFSLFEVFTSDNENSDKQAIIVQQDSKEPKNVATNDRQTTTETKNQDSAIINQEAALQATQQQNHEATEAVVVPQEPTKSTLDQVLESDAENSTDFIAEEENHTLDEENLAETDVVPAENSELSQTTENPLLVEETSQDGKMTTEENDNDDAISTEIDVTNEQLKVAELLKKANQNVKKYRLSRPVNDNATDQFLQVLALDEKNKDARNGLERIGGKYYQLVLSALRKSDYNKALKYSLSFDKFNKKIAFSNKNLQPQKKEILKQIAKIDLTPKSFTTAKLDTLGRIVALYEPEHPLLAEYKKVAKQKDGPQIGEKIVDSLGVESVIITPKLAAMTHEVTKEEYAEFANLTHRQASKCKHIGGGVSLSFSRKTWNKPYFPQTLQHPVVCVTADDAKAFAIWLSQKTGANYRLPNKSEWLLLAANDKNSFEACKTANVAASEALKIRNKQTKYSCKDNYKFTAPVASFKQNKLGIYDIQGNVSEWLACTGSPCQKPTAIGSSWFDGKKSNKIDKVESKKPALAFSNIGFRLMRDL